MAIAQVVGGLAFKRESEQEWFRRRFSMYQDILKDSWVYQEIGQEFLEKGREEERQRRLEGQREMLMSFVQAHFPEITALAKQQADSIADPEVLQSVIIKLLAAQRLDEARQILLDINKSETKH
jgi:predicted transposase YdaD